MTIYSIDADGDVIEYEDIDNGHLLFMIIWEIMFELYNDYFINEVDRPEWMPEDHIMSFSDLQITGDMNPFWKLSKHPDVLEKHRIVFASTFDRMIYFKEDFPRLIKAYENFIETMTGPDFKDFFGKYDFSKLKQFIEILKEIESDETYIGAATCNSLISSFWNEYTESGEYTPYNINKKTNHTNLIQYVDEQRRLTTE